MMLLALVSVLALPLSTASTPQAQQGRNCEDGFCLPDGDGVRCKNVAGACFVGRAKSFECACLGGTGAGGSPGSPDGTVPTYSDEELMVACDEFLVENCGTTVPDPDMLCSAKVRPLCEVYATKLAPRAAECSGEAIPGAPGPDVLTAICCREIGSPDELADLECLAKIDPALSCEALQAAVEQGCTGGGGTPGGDDENSAPRDGGAGDSDGAADPAGGPTKSGDSPDDKAHMESDKGCSIAGPRSATSLAWLLFPLAPSALRRLRGPRKSLGTRDRHSLRDGAGGGATSG